MEAEKTPSQIETECLNEINEVLKKHNCAIDVFYQKDLVLGNPVLRYQPVVTYKGETKKEEI